jgi:hypothetical protein
MDSWGIKVRYGTKISESAEPVHCLYRMAALKQDCKTSTIRRARVIGGMLSRGGMTLGGENGRRRYLLEIIIARDFVAIIQKVDDPTSAKPP